MPGTLTYPGTSHGVAVPAACMFRIYQTLDIDYSRRICRRDSAAVVALRNPTLQRMPTSHRAPGSHAKLHQIGPTLVHLSVRSSPPRGLYPSPSDLFRDDPGLLTRNHFEVMRTVVCHACHA